MYVLKHIPTDFQVQEKITLLLDPQGQYSYYRLEKTDVGTFALVDTLSEMLHVPRKCINLSGIKDKKAVTTQYISILHGPKKDVHSTSFHLLHIGNGNERINRGTLEGNSFIITVRNIQRLPEKIQWIVNYFDAQRFGRDGNNAEIGKCLLKEDFTKAAELVQSQGLDMIGKTPLEKLLSLTKDRLQFYIFAYQSHLWNLVVEQRLSEQKGERKECFFFPIEQPGQEEVPILGFLTELGQAPYGPLYEKLLAQDGLTQHSFLLRRLRGMSLDGSTRPLLALIQEMEISGLEDDESHEGKKKAKVSFFLGKGSYATMVIKRMFGEANIE